MKIELNVPDIKHAIILYLKQQFDIDAAAKDIELHPYNISPIAWERTDENNE